MCRWVCYKSKAPVLLADLLTRPSHSIINQSFDSRLRLDEVRPLNGDGFGVGWYDPDEANEPPCIFTSVLPAWNNPNLERLSAKVKSNMVFCHVRAASSGFPISESNCHPWSFGNLMFQHNGYIAGFNKIKRALQALIPDEIFHHIHGNTDSEWSFGLFLSLLDQPQRRHLFRTDELKDALLQTIATLNALATEAKVPTPSLLNFAVTDGRSIVCSRYTNTATKEAASLYWSSGTKFTCDERGEYQMHKLGKREDIVIISSEPLTFNKSDWCKIPDNTLLMVTPNSNVLLHPIEDEHWSVGVAREPEIPWWTVAGKIRSGVLES